MDLLSYITERNILAMIVALASVFFLLVAWNVLDIWFTHQLSRHLRFTRYLALLVGNIIGNILTLFRLGEFYRTFSEERAFNMAKRQGWEIVGMSKDKRYFKLRRVKPA